MQETKGRKFTVLVEFRDLGRAVDDDGNVVALVGLEGKCFVRGLMEGHPDTQLRLLLQWHDKPDDGASGHSMRRIFWLCPECSPEHFVLPETAEEALEQMSLIGIAQSRDRKNREKGYPGPELVGTLGTYGLYQHGGPDTSVQCPQGHVGTTIMTLASATDYHPSLRHWFDCPEVGHDRSSPIPQTVEEAVSQYEGGRS